MAKQCSPHSSRFVQIQVFFEPDPEGPLGLPDIRVDRVVITGDVIYSSTFVLQWSLVLGVYNLGAQCVGRFVVHVEVLIYYHFHSWSHEQYIP